MLSVSDYFVRLESGLDESQINNLPVVFNGEMETVVGKMLGYNKKTGWVKVHLSKQVPYDALLRVGVPIKNIVFPGVA